MPGAGGRETPMARNSLCAEPRMPVAAKFPAAGLKRTRRPASSSTAARSRLRSMRGNRRIPSHEYACCTCHSRSCSEFIKTFGISSFERGGRRLRSGPRAKTLKCMGNENTGAEQTHKRCNCLNHRKILRAPARTQRHETAHSQKDSGVESKIRPE